MYNDFTIEKDIIALIIMSYFLVESEGLILTNAHVINKPRSSIQVGFCELSTCTLVLEEINFIEIM